MFYYRSRGTDLCIRLSEEYWKKKKHINIKDIYTIFTQLQKV